MYCVNIFIENTGRGLRKTKNVKKQELKSLDKYKTLLE